MGDGERRGFRSVKARGAHSRLRTPTTTPTRLQRRRIIRERRSKVLMQLAAIAFFLLVWELVTVTQLVGIPTPVTTFQTFASLIVTPEPVLGRTLLEHARASLTRVIESALIAFAVAIPLGIAIGWSKRFDYFASTLIEIFRPIPPLALIPLVFALFMTYGNTVLLAQLFIVALAVFLPTVVTVVEGVKAIDPTIVDAARTLGARTHQLLTKVVLYASIPAIFAGVRIGLGIGWASIVAAELIGGSGTGLGYFIMTMYEVGGRMPEIISGIIMIGIIGFLMNEGILWIQHRVIRWA
ncbi:MAG TPA: ABC transporter permease [Candidatus Bathyarchaeia archaeon]|nr:ABC transporter permease [Candidatus Bathyarchaeia archaeon]